MVCSRLLKAQTAGEEGWLVRLIDRSFDTMRRGYQRGLCHSLDYLPVTAC